jgi:hypothetical protein
MHTHCALPVQKPVSGAFLHPYDDVLQAEHEILHSRPSFLFRFKLYPSSWVYSQAWENES